MLSIPVKISQKTALVIESGIFHSAGSNRAVVLTGAKGSNQIILPGKPLLTNWSPWQQDSKVSSI